MTGAVSETRVRPEVPATQTPGGGETRGSTYVPRVDVMERPDRFEILAEMPGARDVDVSFEDGIVVLRGTVAPRVPEGGRLLRREYGVGDFHRAFRVGEAVDAEQIRARYHEGVLEVCLPKRAALQPRKIAVQAG